MLKSYFSSEENAKSHQTWEEKKGKKNTETSMQ
jgi:hypothetical protein